MGTPHRRDDVMSTRDGYLFFEAGQAVAAVHLGLTVRQVSVDPAQEATDIVIPRHDGRQRMVLWLTGMAAEKKGAGRADPLRQMRTRQRVRGAIEALMMHLEGTPAKRRVEAQTLLNQAQDRANTICSNLYPAIQIVAAQLREHGLVHGEQVRAAVAAAKKHPAIPA
jgi:hypothetical protein